MRDYFIEPAQTNVELCAQILAQGSSGSERRRVAEAYEFALRQVFPLVRGSGKPFICHLVGTASVVLESRCDSDWVIAALLHAVYQRRIPFAGDLEPASRRQVIADRFGPGVDALVARYTDFESADLAAIPMDELKADADVVTLRLADELEDICGFSLALHGSVAVEEPSQRGSAAWRRDAKMAEASTLVATAELLGLTGLARGLAHWLDFGSCPDELRDFRTGWYSSTELTR